MRNPVARFLRDSFTLADPLDAGRRLDATPGGDLQMPDHNAIRCHGLGLHAFEQSVHVDFGTGRYAPPLHFG